MSVNFVSFSIYAKYNTFILYIISPYVYVMLIKCYLDVKLNFMSHQRLNPQIIKGSHFTNNQSLYVVELDAQQLCHAKNENILDIDFMRS